MTGGAIALPKILRGKTRQGLEKRKSSDRGERVAGSSGEKAEGPAGKEEDRGGWARPRRKEKCIPQNEKKKESTAYSREEDSKEKLGKKKRKSRRRVYGVSNRCQTGGGKLSCPSHAKKKKKGIKHSHHGAEEQSRLTTFGMMRDGTERGGGDVVLARQRKRKNLR